MEKKQSISENYLYLPIQAGKEETLIQIFCLDEVDTTIKIMECMVPIGKEVDGTYSYDYLARFPVKQFTDKTLTLKGDVPEAFMKEVFTASFLENEPLERPSIHFSADSGWINDPNGLLYKDGVYHLYFQYNPFNTSWNNMCWGHAVSKDLLHWTQEDTVLFPDEDGMIFSGSGIVNEKELLQLPKDALLFFYTAAGGSNEWGKDKQFTQKMAYSLDGGETLIKTELGKLEAISKENRDPKVFWHEESNAYIMCLWLEKNDFAILRSQDLEQYEITDRLTLEEAWECPDLMKVPSENGKEQWVFWTADGFYYFGDFDGYQFKTDGVRHHAYMNKLPYAAQSYHGTAGRVVSLSWIRTKHKDRLYTGAMGLPRELSVIEIEGNQYLSQNIVKEFDAAKKQICSKVEKDSYIITVSDATEIKMQLKDGKTGIIAWNVCGTNVSYDSDAGLFQVGDECYEIGKNIKDFSFVMDDTILEVTANRGIIVGVFELIRTLPYIQAKMDSFEVWDSYTIRS